MTDIDPAALQASIDSLTPELLAEMEAALRDVVENLTPSADEAACYVLIHALQQTQASLWRLRDEAKGLSAYGARVAAERDRLREDHDGLLADYNRDTNSLRAFRDAALALGPHRVVSTPEGITDYVRMRDLRDLATEPEVTR